MDTKQKFINSIKSLGIDTKYAIIKPNWVSNAVGEYTEPEILDWLLEALPSQKKIIVEAYTPWRGCAKREVKIGLKNGKKDWQKYIDQDNRFLKNNGIDKILKKHDSTYLNITNEYWNNNCTKNNDIENLVQKRFEKLEFQEFYGFMPKQIMEVASESTFISLAKVKTETQLPSIVTSLSIKNLFGLIPHPSRRRPYHFGKHSEIPKVITEINKLYASIFRRSVWVNEAIFTWVENYTTKNQVTVPGEGWFLADTDPIKLDSKTCEIFGINPKSVPYLELMKGVWKNHENNENNS